MREFDEPDGTILGNPNPLLASMRDTFATCLLIAELKNADYATGEDQFQNFRRSTVVGVPVDRAILVRLMDKLARISNLLDKEHTVDDESKDDSINDAINYLAILKAWLHRDE